MGNNNFTQTYADGAALTAAKLTTAFQTLTPDISNTTQMTSGTTAGTFLKSNGDGVAASFASVPDPLGPFALRNYGLSTSVSTGALTVALKTNAGTDPSSTDKVNLTFANAGTTSGTYTAIDVTGALSITLNASATLGYTATSASKIYVYAINNAGTVRLALSARSDLDQGQPTATTTISAAADSASALYATATLSVVARLLGWVNSAHNTGGSWQTATRTALLNHPLSNDTPTADQIAQGFSSVGADAIAATMTATGASSIATTMNSTGADQILTTSTKFIINEVAKSADYTITDSDKYRTIFATTGSSTITITLPAAANNTSRIITVKKVDSGSGLCVVAGTIDAATNFSIAGKNEAITVQSDGTNWKIIATSASSWQTWTPTLGISSPMSYGSTSIIYARWMKNNKTVHFAVRFTGTVSGSAPSTGSLTFTLPISASSLSSSNIENSFSAISVGNTANGVGFANVDSTNRALVNCSPNTSSATTFPNSTLGMIVSGTYEVD